MRLDEIKEQVLAGESEIYVSLSYGKDSLAVFPCLEELGLPIAGAVHAEIWATDDIPADLPPMMEFKAKADEIIKQRWGVDVIHTCAMTTPDKKYGVFQQPCEGGANSHTKDASTPQTLKASGQETSRDSQSPEQAEDGASTSSIPSKVKLTYQDLFYRPTQSKKMRGGTRGFPIRGGNWCTSDLKRGGLRIPYIRQQGVTTAPSSNFSTKPQNEGRDINIVQALGIAADEPQRIEKHIGKKNIILPLYEAGWTEPMCREWCEKNDLLSPIYTTATRGGVLVLSQSRRWTTPAAPKELSRSMAVTAQVGYG